VVEDEDCCVEDDEYGADDADNDDCEDECDDSSQDSGGVESDENRSEDDSLGEEGEDFSKILSQSPPDSMQKHAH
jgi:hypothetical protein